MAATDAYGRSEPTQDGTEAATLLTFLDYHRATLEWKCSGLSDGSLRASLPPTSMTLGGILKHMAYNENYWCAEVIGGYETPAPWCGPGMEKDPDWDWKSASDDSGDQLHALRAASVEWSCVIVRTCLATGDERAALSALYPTNSRRGQVSLRWVLVHLIEEYARHNGHADLIRQSIDGQIGD